MKVSTFPRVEALVAARNHLIGLNKEGRIEITIGGVYQNRDFVAHVEPAIRLELRHMIVEIDDRLQDLGVVIDA